MRRLLMTGVFILRNVNLTGTRKRILSTKSPVRHIKHERLCKELTYNEYSSR